MGGESLDVGVLTPAGLVGDRLWAVLDADGEIKSARQWPRLLQMTASYIDAAQLDGPAYADAVPQVTIQLPDATSVRSDTPDAVTALAGITGHECRLEPLRPPSDTDFYALPNVRNTDNLDAEPDKLDDDGDINFSPETREILDLLRRYMTPPGTFFDAFPLHLLSTQSLAFLADQSSADADYQRFRPNVLLDFGDNDLRQPEFGLLGKRVLIGDTTLNVQLKTLRCSIPARPQRLLGLAHDPAMTRAMVDLFERLVGVYATVETAGEIRVGSPVYVDD